MKYLCLLVLSGCTTLSLQQLETQYLNCIHTGNDCTEETIALERRERAIKRRLGCQLCPKPLIDYHDRVGHLGCVTADQLRGIL